MSATPAPGHPHARHDEQRNEAIAETKTERCKCPTATASSIECLTKSNESPGLELALAGENQGSAISDAHKIDDPLPMKYVQLVLLGLAMALAVFLMALDEGIIGKS